MIKMISKEFKFALLCTYINANILIANFLVTIFSYMVSHLHEKLLTSNNNNKIQEKIGLTGLVSPSVRPLCGVAIYFNLVIHRYLKSQ